MAFPVPRRISHERDSGHRARQIPLAEPIGAIGKPPAKDEDGDGHSKSPPEGEEKVNGKAKEGKSHPENLALHGRSLPWIPIQKRECLAIVA